MTLCMGIAVSLAGEILEVVQGMFVLKLGDEESLAFEDLGTKKQAVWTRIEDVTAGKYSDRQQNRTGISSAKKTVMYRRALQHCRTENANWSSLCPVKSTALNNRKERDKEKATVINHE